MHKSKGIMSRQHGTHADHAVMRDKCLKGKKECDEFGTTIN